jgi:hypothetical protein
MFTTDTDFQRLDYRLLQNGAVSLFWAPGVLEEAQEELNRLGYDLLEVSCLVGPFSFERQMSDALRWEDQFGYAPWTGNLDALNDGLGYYPFGQSGKAALILRGFQALVSRDADFAWHILDLIEKNARYRLLEGKILIGLVQTDDNRYTCPPLGGHIPQWNGREWTNRDRGL